MGLPDWKRIVSRGNPLIVQTAKLSSRKFREERSAFFFEGAHLLEEYLRFGGMPENVFVREDCAERYLPLLSPLPPETVAVVSAPVYDKMTGEQAPQGILTVARVPACVPAVTDATEVPGRVILLESVRDNGNVGTVIRTAAALGWTCVLTTDCADLFSPKTVRASMGALFSGCAALCPDPVSFIRSFESAGRRTFAAALAEGGEILGRFDVKEGDCFIVGNEGQGISPELADAAGRTVRIPMTDAAESLNAAAAAAVLMWEGARTDGTLKTDRRKG